MVGQLFIPRAREMGRLDAHRHGGARLPVLHWRGHAAVVRAACGQGRFQTDVIASRVMARLRAGGARFRSQPVSDVRLRDRTHSERAVAHRPVLRHCGRICRVHRAHGFARNSLAPRRAHHLGFRDNPGLVLGAAVLRPRSGLRRSGIRSGGQLAGLYRPRRDRHAALLPALQDRRPGRFRSGRHSVDVARLLQCAVGCAGRPVLRKPGRVASRPLLQSSRAPC